MFELFVIPSEKNKTKHTILKPVFIWLVLLDVFFLSFCVCTQETDLDDSAHF